MSGKARTVSWASLIAVLSLLAGFGATQWIMPALLKANSIDTTRYVERPESPDKYLLYSEFSRYESGHQKWGEEVIKRLEGGISSAASKLDALDRNFDYIARRQDELIKLLREKHADASFDWETVFP